MTHIEFKEDELFLISALDYSQEKAVVGANNEQEVLIVGKEYSGKKETIINIISNSLYNEKKVLIVSKDENELENIYNRLGYVKTQSLLLNRRNFILDIIYKNTHNRLLNISKNTGKTTLSKINVLSRDIEKKLEMLNKINKLFTTKRSCGLNLLEMYTFTNQKISTSDTIYEYYNIFTIRKPFSDYKYEDLKESVDNILSLNIINKYVKYRRFKQNKLFSNILKNLTSDNILLALRNVEVSLNNPLVLRSPLVYSKYTDDIVKYYLSKELLDEDSYEKISKQINEKHNAEIRYEQFSKWNPLFWIKYKSIVKHENELKLNFTKENINILKDIHNTINSINIYIEGFSYLKYIISEDEYTKFISTLLTTEDFAEYITEYLISLRNILNIYITLSSLTAEVNELGYNEKEVLEYCYDNLEIKEDIKDLLINLPTIFLFHNIEEIETKEKDVLHYYKNFELILKEIQLSMDTKISFIPLAIKYIWDNKISENLLLNPDEYNTLYTLVENSSDKINIDNFIEYFSPLILNIYPCIISSCEYVDRMIPNIQGLFDVVIFYDGNNIYPDEIEKNVYISNTKIITSNNAKYENGCILDNYSDMYYRTDLDHEYSYNISKQDEIKSFTSYLQQEICEFFTRKGFKIKLNVNISGYILNLIFYSRDYKDEILAIECDDLIYNSNYNSREIELSKRRYFEKRGLNLIRIWSRDWWLNKKAEIKKIQRLLDDSKIAINE